MAGLLLSLMTFVVLEQAIGNATGALAITDGIPILWLVVYGISRRRIEPVGLIAVAVFTLALVLTLAFGGSSLPLELRRSVFPGAVGLACLVSPASRRPLLSIASTKLADARPKQIAETRPKLDTPSAQRALTAERIGLISSAVGADELEQATQQLVDELLANSHVAVGHAKRVLDMAARPTLAQGLALELTTQAYCLAMLRSSSEPAVAGL